MTTPKEGPSQGPPPLHTAIDLTDILSLTDFQRAAKQHISRLRRTGKAQVLTVNGAAALVVQDAKSYQRLLDEVASLRERLSTRSALVAARVEDAGDAPPTSRLPVVAAGRASPKQSGAAANAQTSRPTNPMASPVANPVASPQVVAQTTEPATPKPPAKSAPEPAATTNTPATDGLARALAQLRQQVAGAKREGVQIG
jgi:hypothetical protein